MQIQVEEGSTEAQGTVFGLLFIAAAIAACASQ